MDAAARLHNHAEVQSGAEIRDFDRCWGRGGITMAGISVICGNWMNGRQFLASILRLSCSAPECYSTHCGSNRLPVDADAATLRQYTRCYILLLIGGYLMTNKSNNQVHIGWLPLLDNFARCRGLSWGSAMLAWTYHSLCYAAHRNTTDIAGCTPLLVSWLYHKFPQWCPPERQIPRFPLVMSSYGCRTATPYCMP
ncbi:hypothetical protein Ahy_B10g105205 [Arachis hypogaea]|uniref:Aminotransferase-like plant mobile domain-containing protein n=1 Tax=Arachis hypogaea TaxID=3818 RepID=A0A444X7L6_ARAHY|nr:hypothetical protein Ahy_B10g105205 [Arachis hypogaea]